MQRGPFWPLEATKREKHYSRDPKILYFPFSGLQRPKMTFLHKIQKNSFQNQVFLCFMKRGLFWSLEATKREKSYFGDPKILSFSVFRPPEAENDLLALNTKKIFSKSFFFVLLISGHFWPLKARKREKLY